MKSLSLRIPASSGNIGAGFDSFGIAFNLYNTFRISWQEEYAISYSHAHDKSLLDAKQNYVISSYEVVCKKLGKPASPFALDCDNRLPPASGFGSSGTAALAGCTAALLQDNDQLDRQQLLQLVCELEGHPDNVAASLFGGFVISYYHQKQSWAHSFPISDELSYWVILPELQTYTQAARQKIPDCIDRQAVVFNLSHAALTAAAYSKQDYGLLTTGVHDRIHEYHRDMPQLDYSGLKQQLSQTDVLAVSLCGSGPAILVLRAADDTSHDRQRQIVHDHFAKLNITWREYILKADNQGMTID